MRRGRVGPLLSCSNAWRSVEFTKVRSAVATGDVGRDFCGDRYSFVPSSGAVRGGTVDSRRDDWRDSMAESVWLMNMVASSGVRTTVAPWPRVDEVWAMLYGFEIEREEAWEWEWEWDLCILVRDMAWCLGSNRLILDERGVEERRW